jgi:small subunit ribosomal protein S18b
MTTQETYECHVLVIGSGIAGMSFLETFESLCPDLKVIMTSMTPLMKIARVTKRQGRGIEHLDIQEVTIHETGNDKLDHGQENNDLQCLKSSNFTFLLDRVTSIDPDSHVVTTKKRRTIHYRYVCVCSGGRPDVIKGDNSFILGVRDTASVKTLSARLNNSRKVIIVGNGGIATELVHELLNCHIVWVIKDKNISSTFFDAAASKFFFDCRQGPNATQNEQNKDTFHVCSDKESREDKSDKKEKVDYFDSTFVTKSRRKGVLSRKYVCDPETTETEGEGSALGPDWSFNTLLKGSLKDKQLDIEYETQISEVLSKSSFLAKYANISADYSRVSESDFPAVVLLSNGKVLTCDLVVSATGVIPNTQVFQDDSRFIISTQDGGVLVSYS